MFFVVIQNSIPLSTYRVPAAHLLALPVNPACPPIQCSELLPQVAVEDTVVNRFVQMMELDVVGGFEVGDRAGQTQDFVVGSSAESHFVDVDS